VLNPRLVWGTTVDTGKGSACEHAVNRAVNNRASRSSSTAAIGAPSARSAVSLGCITVRVPLVVRQA